MAGSNWTDLNLLSQWLGRTGTRKGIKVLTHIAITAWIIVACGGAVTVDRLVWVCDRWLVECEAALKSSGALRYIVGKVMEREESKAKESKAAGTTPLENKKIGPPQINPYDHPEQQRGPADHSLDWTVSKRSPILI